MSKFGVLVMGPAGAGKTTFCTALAQHLAAARRRSFYVNLDPAADALAVAPDLDIRDLVALEDVMAELGLGPNGGLLYCFDFLLQNLDFLHDALDPLPDDVLVLFDLPGQIELYTHVPLLPALVRFLGRAGALNLSLCAAYLLESSFVVDRPKFFAGALSAMSAMLLLEIPHVNLLSKMDQLRGLLGARELRQFTAVDVGLLDAGGQGGQDGQDAAFDRLNRAVAQLIDDFSMVSFLKLDVQREDSLAAVLSYIDDAIQYHEAQEPREPPADDPPE